MASEEGVSVQTVKLKVLYTFDAEQKDNHLARWPHSLEVNTCYIDSTNQIGVVDLRTCLDSVTSASPELLSKIDTDYAVYALDFSEEDTPLVGQGMLSKHSAAQDDPAVQDSEAMITGRITKGAMGLLSKNAQPTLEVKLKLKPVAAFPSQRTRSGSVTSQEGRIPQWLNGSDASLAQSMQRPMSPMQTSGLESMQRMLSEGGPPRDRMPGPGLDAASHSRPVSRAGTPTLQPNFNAPQRQSSNARRDSFNSGYYSGEDNGEDGPARKRARITKVDWPNKSNLNIERQSDSLRRAASTASSVRLHRPIAINPAINPQNESLSEEPVRPPTPIPTTKTGKPRVGRPRRPRPSTLKKQTDQQEPISNLGGPMQSDFAEGAASSPEDVRPRSVSSTPANIPSSPPVMPVQQGPMVTSPVLPPMLDHHHDSGFMSGNLDDLFGDVNEQILNFDDYVIDKGDTTNTLMFGQQTFEQDENKYEPVFEDGNEVEAGPSGPAEIQPKEFARPPPPSRPMSRAQSYTPVMRAGMSSPKLAPAPIPRARQIMEEQKARGLTAQLPQSEPGRLSLHRSNTWAPDMSDALMSEAPTANGDEDSKQKSKKKVGKAQTKARLENAIATGEMPPFCDNCGNIETPAWRRAWSKLFTCPWDEVDTSLAPGELCWKDPLNFADDGTITKFRGLKAEKRAGDEDDGWTQVNLCNPCGLWFHKQKCPRPKEKWQKQPKDRRRRRGTKPTLAQQKAPLMPRSDAPTPMSDDSSPTDTAAEGDENDEDNTGEEERSDSNEPQLPRMPHNMRANSAEPTGRGLNHVQPKRPFPRQTHSSPGRGHGSEAEPIEVELTPKPIRRMLFPSPDKQQTVSDPTNNSTIAHMVTKLPAFVRRSPRLNKVKDVFQAPGLPGAVAITSDGKENIIPDFTVENFDFDNFDNFDFDIGLEGIQLPPTTPQRRSERILAKTPQRQFGTDLSPNLHQSPTRHTPKLKSAERSVLADFMGTSKKDLDNATPKTRAIQETWDRADFGVNFFSPSNPRKTPKRTSPKKQVGLDFPDLPSLNDSSPMTSGQMFNIDFSELTTDRLQTDMPDLFSTDAVMPSSPPGFYNFINLEGDMGESIEWNTAIEKVPEGLKESEYPEPEELAMNAPQPLRRSPRKNKD